MKKLRHRQVGWSTFPGFQDGEFLTLLWALLGVGRGEEGAWWGEPAQRGQCDGHWSLGAGRGCGQHSLSRLWVACDCKLGLLKWWTCACDWVGGALCVCAPVWSLLGLGRGMMGCWRFPVCQHFSSRCWNVHSMCVLSHSLVSNPFATPWTVACQAPLFMEFSKQEYWSGLPFPTPGDLPDPGIKPASLVSPTLADGFFTTVPTGKPFGNLQMC